MYGSNFGIAIAENQLLNATPSLMCVRAALLCCIRQAVQEASVLNLLNSEPNQTSESSYMEKARLCLLATAPSNFLMSQKFLHCAMQKAAFCCATSQEAKPPLCSKLVFFIWFH